jgi:hypothetical protein
MVLEFILVALRGAIPGQSHKGPEGVTMRDDYGRFTKTQSWV